MCELTGAQSSIVPKEVFYLVDDVRVLVEVLDRLDRSFLRYIINASSIAINDV
jgi:hypothetical protein